VSGDRIWIAAVAIGGALVVVAALAIAGVFDGGNGGGEPVADDFGSIEAQEAAAPEEPQVKRIRVGGRPDAIAAGAGYVWVVDSLAGTLKRIQPESLRPVDVQAAGFPTDVSAGTRGAWLALPDRGAVQRVTVEGPGPPVELSQFPFQIAVGEGAAWAMSQNSVQRVDESGGNLDGPPMKLGGSGSAIAAGEGWVWVARNNREVVRIQPPGGAPESAADVPGAFNIAVGESAAWVLGAKGTLTRLDPETGEPAGDAVQTGRGTDVAAGLGYVWVTSDNGTVIRFDPESGAEVGVPIDVGIEPTSIAVGEGSAWVASADDGAVYKITP
jgi:hypothetical protein